MNEKHKDIAKVIIYSKILLSKGEVFIAGLLAAKAHDMLALSDAERDELKESDDGYQKLDARYPKGVPAIEVIQHCLTQEYPDNAQNIKNIIKLQRNNPNENISRIRNRIIHEYSLSTLSSENDREKFLKDVEKLVNALFDLPFVSFVKDEYYGGNIDCNYEAEREIKLLLSRVHSYENDAIDNKQKNREAIIKEEYFGNLIKARNELFPAISNEIQAVGREKEEEIKYLDLNHISISSVDSTSAYIWLSVPIKVPTLKKSLTTRRKIYIPSMSIVFTPREIWIYLEFAGLNFHYKAWYYNYLINKEKFDELYLSMINKEHELCSKPLFRDVIWYVFEENRICLTNDINKTYDEIIKHLYNILLNRKDTFTKCLDNNCPITWNILLPGWILPAQKIHHITIKKLVDEFYTCCEGLEPLISEIKSQTRIMKNKPEKIIDKTIKSISKALKKNINHL